MLPALALGRAIKNAGADNDTTPVHSPLAALDMCSSPGGKSSLLASLLGPNALVLANEPAPKRLATLRRNLEMMNLLNTATCGHSGEAIPLASAGADGFAGFDHILLDPPCSGWGTVDKNPQVLNLWQGDKIKPLIGLQRMLLREAIRLLKPGGCLSYSTCTVNVQENEEQVQWALGGLNDEIGGGLELMALEPFPGFLFDDPLLGCDGTLRVSQESELGQGFYIAAFRKPDTAKMLAPAKNNVLDNTKPVKRKNIPSFADVQYFEPALIKSPLTDTSMLPPGRLAQQGTTMYFQHICSQNLPEAFSWRQFPLGKNARPDTGLHALMPTPEQAIKNGADILQVDKPEQILALLSGQSLQMPASGAEVGLYYKNLPLCRLKARGGRVFI